MESYCELKDQTLFIKGLLIVLEECDNGNFQLPQEKIEKLIGMINEDLLK